MPSEERRREMDFDRYTISLLIHRTDAPDLDESAAADLQDAHMSHLADLHEAGILLAAGPLFDERYRGLSILNGRCGARPGARG
jgi:hypothetical protein